MSVFLNMFMNPLGNCNPLFGGSGALNLFGGGMGNFANMMLGGMMGQQMGGLVGLMMGGLPGSMMGGSIGGLLGTLLGGSQGNCGCHQQNFNPGCGNVPQPWQNDNCCRPRWGGCQDNGGDLQQNQQGGPINYTTHGGYGVQVNGSTVTITNPNGKHQVVEWGDPHEKLDGQAVDHGATGDQWNSNRRTIILGDGTRVTMDASGHNTPVQSTSIYDGNRNVQINNNNNQVTHDSSNPWDTEMRENRQYTGETGYFGPDGKGGYTLTDMYNQNSSGDTRPAYKDLGNVGDSWWKSLLNFFGMPQQTSAWA